MSGQWSIPKTMQRGVGSLFARVSNPCVFWVEASGRSGSPLLCSQEAPSTSATETNFIALETEPQSEAAEPNGVRIPRSSTGFRFQERVTGPVGLSRAQTGINGILIPNPWDLIRFFSNSHGTQWGPVTKVTEPTEARNPKSLNPMGFNSRSH